MTIIGSWNYYTAWFCMQEQCNILLRWIWHPRCGTFHLKEIAPQRLTPRLMSLDAEIRNLLRSSVEAPYRRMLSVAICAKSNDHKELWMHSCSFLKRSYNSDLLGEFSVKWIVHHFFWLHIVDNISWHHVPQIVDGMIILYANEISVLAFNEGLSLVMWRKYGSWQQLK